MAISTTTGSLSEAPSLIKDAEAKILTGWKEIATYLRKGVRTVQRYERELGLPIRRFAGKSKGSVLAMKADIDGWLPGCPLGVQPLSNGTPAIRRANQLRANFLQIDSQIGLTFSGIALTASDPGKKNRTSQYARQAYETILRFRDEVDFSDPEWDKLEVNLRRLKIELQSLGQRF